MIEINTVQGGNVQIRHSSVQEQFRVAGIVEGSRLGSGRSFLEVFEVTGRR